ncbi:hypothetical protein LAZ67_1001956 [Cordylochernes scorpioides]|uniref:Uncharacterized protein n=1 Tax=Cordylochernes scorpioides TaxID=51811 RepID=A0ABY6JVT6_9ARAC|nr:hypothetical protein LAZ67_1001956 [Cordylochernes scorpioides]
MLLASDSEIIIQNTIKTLEKEFEIKNLGDPTQFIGIEISRNREGELLLSQKNKIQELVERPDIAAPVCILSSRNQNPRNCDWNAAKRIVRYLKTTKELELRISNQKPPTLEAYSDATWASDNTDRKSLSGNLFLLGSNPISWMTGKQGCVSLSSTEAELISAAEASQELLWLLDLLKDLELEQKAPIYFHQDNQSCLKICSSEKVSSRTKHIATKIHHLKDLQKKTVIKMIYCPTGDMKADILTKPLPRPTFEKLRYNLVMSPHSCRGFQVNSPSISFSDEPGIQRFEEAERPRTSPPTIPISETVLFTAEVEYDVHATSYPTPGNASTRREWASWGQLEKSSGLVEELVFCMKIVILTPTLGLWFAHWHAGVWLGTGGVKSTTIGHPPQVRRLDYRAEESESILNSGLVLGQMAWPQGSQSLVGAAKAKGGFKTPSLHLTITA